jgi:hypothetical protein
VGASADAPPSPPVRGSATRALVVSTTSVGAVPIAAMRSGSAAAAAARRSCFLVVRTGALNSSCCPCAERLRLPPGLDGPLSLVPGALLGVRCSGDVGAGRGPSAARGGVCDNDGGGGRG